MKNKTDVELNAIIYYMQKGWTPRDFSDVENENMWHYYVVAYEIAQEKKREEFNEYARLGVMRYGG